MDQVQINKMLQDNLMILDTAFSAISSAEKIVFGIKEGKKYGYYDKNDTASWRSKEELKCELMTKIQCLNGMMQLYSKRYPNQKIRFANNLNKKEILEDLYSLRDEVIKNKKISKYEKYYTDLINLFTVFKCKKYTEKEILEGTETNKKLTPQTEEEVIKLANNFFELEETIEKRNEDFNNLASKNGGEFFYNFQTDNKPKKIEKDDYFRNFYYK